jgi:hypothetical protein
VSGRILGPNPNRGYASAMFPRSLPSRRALGLGLALALAAAACGGGAASTAPSGPSGSGSAACQTAPSDPDDLAGWGPPATAPAVYPTIIAVAGQLACGPTRLLFTITDATGRPIGSPDRSVKLDLFDLAQDPTKPIASVDGTFVWAIKDQRGIYYANVDFPEAGRYGAQFTTAVGSAAPDTLRLTLDVQPSSPAIAVGDKAPSVKTPTLSDVGGDVARISTDATPDPKFYETSLDAALAAHKPVALIFATPKFCTSSQCGPTLDSLKPYVAKYPTVTFINVEPYKLKLVDGALQADTDADNQLQETDVSAAWNLLVEPTVYVIDRQGIVRDKFDLIFSDQEITAALDAVK